MSRPLQQTNNDVEFNAIQTALPFHLQIVFPSQSETSPTFGHQNPRRNHSIQELSSRAANKPYTVLCNLLNKSAPSLSRPGSSDSGFSEEPSEIQSFELANNDFPLCRICFTRIKPNVQSACTNCGHVACVPCLLQWFRTNNVCFLCRTPTESFTLLYL